MPSLGPSAGVPLPISTASTAQPQQSLPQLQEESSQLPQLDGCARLAPQPHEGGGVALQPQLTTTPVGSGPQSQPATTTTPGAHATGTAPPGAKGVGLPSMVTVQPAARSQRKLRRAGGGAAVPEQAARANAAASTTCIASLIGSAAEARRGVAVAALAVCIRSASGTALVGSVEAAEGRAYLAGEAARPGRAVGASGATPAAVRRARATRRAWWTLRVGKAGHAATGGTEGRAGIQRCAVGVDRAAHARAPIAERGGGAVGIHEATLADPILGIAQALAAAGNRAGRKTDAVRVDAIEGRLGAAGHRRADHVGATALAGVAAAAAARVVAEGVRAGRHAGGNVASTTLVVGAVAAAVGRAAVVRGTIGRGGAAATGSVEAPWYVIGAIGPGDARDTLPDLGIALQSPGAIGRGEAADAEAGVRIADAGGGARRAPGESRRSTIRLATAAARVADTAVALGAGDAGAARSVAGVAWLRVAIRESAVRISEALNAAAVRVAQTIGAARVGAELLADAAPVAAARGTARRGAPARGTSRRTGTRRSGRAPAGAAAAVLPPEYANARDTGRSGHAELAAGIDRRVRAAVADEQVILARPGAGTVRPRDAAVGVTPAPARVQARGTAPTAPRGGREEREGAAARAADQTGTAIRRGAAWVAREATDEPGIVQGKAGVAGGECQRPAQRREREPHRSAPRRRTSASSPARTSIAAGVASPPALPQL